MTELSDVVILAEAIEKLAEAINHHAAAHAAQNPPGGPPVGAPPPAAGAPTPAASGPPGGSPSEDSRIKKSKKVFAVCAKNGWDIADAGLRATGRNLGADSRKWSVPDLNIVLDKLDEWVAQTQRAQEPF